MKRHVLLIEDDEMKRQSIANVVARTGLATLVLANSVRSAIDAICRSSFALIIADMSLPTFDIESRERGGTPRPFGGIEVFEFLDRMEKLIPIIVVTSYPAISDGKKSMSISDLERTLSTDFPETFAGIVYFDFTYAGWEGDFLKALIPLLGANDAT